MQCRRVSLLIRYYSKVQSRRKSGAALAAQRCCLAARVSAGQATTDNLPRNWSGPALAAQLGELLGAAQLGELLGAYLPLRG
ncbi:hypothetical protein BHM03_00062247 [Ensete ventricosum]|nr:hypothetical protein BHM03_00062247 [Ensete ventricosum]